MDFYSITDQAVAAELGGRLRALRLRRNMTQQQLAAATVLSLNVIKSLEAGRGKLSSLIAVLRELNALQELDQCIPPPLVSPLQLARNQGKQRRRASGKRHRLAVADDGSDSEW